MVKRYKFHKKNDEGSISGQEYFHYVNSEGRNLEGDYWDAVTNNDLTRMGNIEHALGHDVGVDSIGGYHSNLVEGFLEHDILLDTFSVGVDREALNEKQSERASKAAEIQGIEKDKDNDKGGKFY